MGEARCLHGGWSFILNSWVLGRGGSAGSLPSEEAAEAKRNYPSRLRLFAFEHACLTNDPITLFKMRLLQNQPFIKHYLFMLQCTYSFQINIGCAFGICIILMKSLRLFTWVKLCTWVCSYKV